MSLSNLWIEKLIIYMYMHMVTNFTNVNKMKTNSNLKSSNIKEM